MSKNPPNFNPEQLYRISNVAWTTQVTDLLFGNPTGPIAGYHENSASNNQSWLVTHFTDPPIVSFKNGTTGTYAYVSAERQDIPLTGSEQEYKWSLFGIGPGLFQIRTVDYKYLWVLSNPEDETPIVIKLVTEDASWGTEAQWTISPV